MRKSGIDVKLKTSALFFLDAWLVFGDMEGNVAVIRILCRSVSAAVAPLRALMTSVAAVCSIAVRVTDRQWAKADVTGNERLRPAYK